MASVMICVFIREDYNGRRQHTAVPPRYLGAENDMGLPDPVKFLAGVRTLKAGDVGPASEFGKCNGDGPVRASAIRPPMSASHTAPNPT